MTVPPIWTPTSSDDMMGIMTTNNLIVATSAESGGLKENVQEQNITINAMVFVHKVVCNCKIITV